MKIRSVTWFTEAAHPLASAPVVKAGRALRHARQVLEEAGLAVQMTRLALPPLGRVSGVTPQTLSDYGRAVERASRQERIDYATVGPLHPQDDPAFADAVPDLLSATAAVFTASVVATPEGGIDLAALRRSAGIIHRNAPLEPNGFANVRFAALAHVDGGIPFLPAAFHAGGPPQMAVATEAADLAVSAFAGARSLAEARQRLVDAVEAEATRLEELMAPLAAEAGAEFTGIDFSLAPFPTADRSIGGALESLGVPVLGSAGTLAAVAFCADSLDRARFRRAGFCGLFLPVLEDVVLAQRSAEGHLTLGDLLLASAVCGTGLDTIPLAGDVTPEELFALLLDVAALALRLAKPLTARLMPMPGRQAGDALSIDFPYFAQGCVLDHRARPLAGLLAGSEPLHLAPRRR